jgi:putative glutathione S-transferase
MLNSEFNKFARHPDLDLYPESLRSRIDELNDQVYPKLNNGVYRAGFAKSQEAYDAAYEDVFSMLDTLENILSKQRYLIDNEHLTEADVRAWTTLLRFDPVYFTHFKCNKKLITKDYPNLYGFIREIYQINGVKDTVNIDEIKKHYFASHSMINPTGIIARGPEINYDLPHGRDPSK